MFIGRHVPLIGGVTPFHVHLAPYFYWLSGVLLSLFRFNPLIWGYFTAVTSGLSVCLLYIFTKDNFTVRTARVAVFLYAFSFYINAFERHYWGLYFNPLLTLLVLISLTKIIKRHYKYFIVLGGSLAFGFHTDPSTFVLLFLSFIAIIKYRLPILKNIYGKVALLIFIGSFIPLLMFDLRHDFVNIKGVINYKEEIKVSTSLSLNNKINSLAIIPNHLYRIIIPDKNHNLADFYSYCPVLVQKRLNIPQTGTLVGIVILIIIVFGFRKMRGNDSGYKLSNILTSIVFLGIFIYSAIFGRPFFDHYISTLLPVGVLYFALVLSNKKYISNLFLSLILICVFFINFSALNNSYHSNGYKNKNEAVKWAVNNVSGDFSLDSISSCFKYNGYRYLFLLAGHEPVKSYVDSNFFWLFDRQPSENHPPEVVVMVAKDFDQDTRTKAIYLKYKENEIKSKVFGDLEVLISDNTKGIFYDF